MNQQEMLQQMQATWPTTDDYLQRVGQVTNDLAVIRELLATEPPQSWLDALAITQTDLLVVPDAVQVLRFLHGRQVTVPAAETVMEFREDQDEQARMYEAGETSTPDVLEDPRYRLTVAADQLMWQLPELGAALTRWAEQTIERVLEEERQLTLTQAILTMRLFQFLEQESDLAPGWVRESLQSLCSANFFTTAAPRTVPTATS